MISFGPLMENGPQKDNCFSKQPGDYRKATQTNKVRLRSAKNSYFIIWSEGPTENLHNNKEHVAVKTEKQHLTNTFKCVQL